MARDTHSCPNCGSKEIQPWGLLTRRFNLWAFVFGGWLLSLLWSFSRKEEARCLKCETVFRRATLGSKVAWALLLLLIVLAFLTVALTIYDSWPESAR